MKIFAAALVVALIIFLVLAGCCSLAAPQGGANGQAGLPAANAQNTQQTAPAPIACGGPDCFIQAMKNNCSPASLKLEQDVVKTGLVVKGKGTGGCNVEMKLEDFSKPAGMDEQTWSSLSALKPFAKGLSMTCDIDADTAAGLAGASAVADEQMLNKCRGPMKDILVRLTQQAGAQNGQ